MIHSATRRPIPPEPAIPCAQNPAATQKPRYLGRPEDELAVGSEGLRAVHQLDDLSIGKFGHARGGRFEQRREPVPVRRQEPIVEIAGDAGEAPRSRVALVATHHEPAALAAEVDQQRRIADRRHVAGKARPAW